MIDDTEYDPKDIKIKYYILSIIVLTILDLCAKVLAIMVL